MTHPRYHRAHTVLESVLISPITIDVQNNSHPSPPKYIFDITMLINLHLVIKYAM